MVLACLLVTLAAFQEAPPSAPGADRLFLQDRTEFQGQIVALSADGRLRMKASGRERLVEVPLEEVARLRFSADGARPATPAGEQLRLADGGVIAGRIESFDGAFAVVRSAAGPLKIARHDLRAILLEPPATLPELRDEPRDILIHEAPAPAGPRESVASYGRLKSIGERVVFLETAPAEGGAPETTQERTYDRAQVRAVYLWRESPSREASSGLFAKVTLRSGDRWVAVLTGVGADRVSLFSHLFGPLDLDKALLYSISFIQQAQLTSGNLIVTDQLGLHVFDAQRQEIWTYTLGCQLASVARKLRNGNVLVADRATNSVVEIRPSGRAGGEVVWKIEGVETPWDVSRLENGNTLVAEQSRNRVAEYDAKTREVVWQLPVQMPMTAQRLDNGNTLICTFNSVIEWTPSGTQAWEAKLLRHGSIRPSRATRLENGNTLITDTQKGQVVELDANSETVWQKGSLSQPLDAVRLEDGSTMILERGSSQVIEVDPANPRNPIPFVKHGLLNPVGISGY